MNIGAAVSLHSSDRIAIKSGVTPKIPILYGVGTADIMSNGEPRSSLVRKMYERTPVAKAYANILNANHYEPTSKDNRWLPYTISMFDCHLKDSKYACAHVYGSSYSDPCSLCKCHEEIRLKKCIHANEPEFI